MKKKKTYAVFGLGRYGISVAKELVSNGMEVLAVDIDESKVNESINEVPLCKCADITDIEVIKQLGISNIDTVIIAMGHNLEASVMAVMLCKEVGVKTVIVKCANEMYQKILLKVGADQAVIPEKESGKRLAKNLISAGFADIMELSNDIAILEIDIKEEWKNKTLLELNLRKKYGTNVIAIRKNQKLEIDIDPNLELKEDMKLVVLTSKSKIKKII